MSAIGDTVIQDTVGISVEDQLWIMEEADRKMEDLWEHTHVDPDIFQEYCEEIDDGTFVCSPQWLMMEEIY